MADIAKLRWYRLTPGRAVLGLLAVEVLLLLSARFCWFPFNHHKGWTVVIAVAMVGVFFLLMSLWFLAALVFRWRFQFTLGSLLLLPLVVTVGFGWLATEMKQAKRQREVVEWIKKAGGDVWYFVDVCDDGTQIGSTANPAPTRLRWLFGDDLFVDVRLVQLEKISDADMEHLKSLNKLQSLALCNCKVSDAGLRQIERFTGLQSLTLWCPEVSDVGLVHLRSLIHLRYVDISSEKVSDVGLVHLRSLIHLRYVEISSEKVTARGIRDLKKALPNAHIIEW